MMKIQNRHQALLVAAIALVALFVGDKILLTPLVRAWKDRAARVTQLRQQVTEGRRLLERQDALRARWDSMRTNTLPGDLSLAEQEILKAFDVWSQANRVSILSLTPQWKRDADDFLTLECRVDASGNLAALSRFLYDIEKDPLGLKLDTVELTARDQDGQQLALGLLISGLALTPTNAP